VGVLFFTRDSREHELAESEMIYESDKTICKGIYVASISQSSSSILGESV